MNRVDSTRRLAPQSRGFTIVETLIVLAVTGVMFTSMALLINGRQNKTNFQVGSRAIVQQIQQVINEAQSGYYPHAEDFSCTANSGNNVEFVSGPGTLGKNGACIFVGKTLVFASTSPESYSVYSLAGRRLESGVDDVASPGQAWITVIPSATQTQSTPNNITYYGGRVAPSPSWNTDTPFPVAFLSGLANFGGASSESGSQRIELRGYSGASSWSGDISDLPEEINAEANQTSPYGDAVLPGVELCFNSGGTGQSVIVSISDGLRVSYKIMAKVNCEP